MKRNNIYLIGFILVLLVTFNTNFSRSFHNILFKDYDNRISNVYGFCEKEGIGYVNFIKKKFYIDGKIKLRNSLKQNNNNSGEWAVYNSNFDKEKKPDYLILINYEKLSSEFNLDEFKILHQFKDCYLLKYND